MSFLSRKLLLIAWMTFHLVGVYHHKCHLYAKQTYFCFVWSNFQKNCTNTYLQKIHVIANRSLETFMNFENIQAERDDSKSELCICQIVHNHFKKSRQGIWNLTNNISTTSRLQIKNHALKLMYEKQDCFNSVYIITCKAMV